MSLELFSVLMFASVIVLFLLGVPLAFSFGAVAVVFGFIWQGDTIFPWMVLRTWSLMKNFSFIAIPLFVFMAYMLSRSGIAEDLFEAMHRWMGPLRGSLAMATVAASTILAAMMGTAGGEVTVMGVIALPFMLKHKYNKSIALGSILAGGSLGTLIPPSIVIILYAIFAGQSVGKMFMGGVFPGLLLATLYIGYIGIRSWLQPSAGPALPEEERAAITLRMKFGYLKALIFPILLIFAVLGSIYAGIATPTEAAGLGATGVMLIAIGRRRLNWGNLKTAVFDTLRTVAMIFWISFSAFVFVGVFALAGGGELIRDFILSLNLNPWVFIIAIQVLFIIMGTFMGFLGILLLVIPITLPIVAAYGINPLWFGMLYVINMQIAYLSPPIGFALFYLKGVVPPGITMTDIWRGALPFMGLQIVGLSLVMAFPQIALWLPTQMIK